MLLTAGVWLAAVLLVVGVCACVAPVVIIGDWWAVGFCAAPVAVVTGGCAVVVVSTVAGCNPGGEGLEPGCGEWCTVGFIIAGVGAVVTVGLFKSAPINGVGTRLGLGCIVCAVWVVIPSP